MPGVIQTQLETQHMENVLEAGAGTSPGVGDGGASDANRGDDEVPCVGSEWARGERPKWEGHTH